MTAYSQRSIATIIAGVIATGAALLFSIGSSSRVRRRELMTEASETIRRWIGAGTSKRMELILSTGNIMGGGPSVIRRPGAEKSNTELISALRNNVLLSQQGASLDELEDGHTSRPNDTLTIHHPTMSQWTIQDGSILYIPAPEFDQSGLAEERSQYDITVKLFFLPSGDQTDRDAQISKAVSLVLKQLHVPSIDLLIISFPDVVFDEETEKTCDANAGAGSPEGMEVMIQTWQILEDLYSRGVIQRLGISEFSSERLGKFIQKVKVRPAVDQINLRDVCSVPKDLALLAKEQDIQLLTHNDCTNILPRGTLRELLGPGVQGAGILAGPGNDDGLTGEVEPQWVVKYTAVVKNRGVVEDKGYFAVARLVD